MAHNGGSSANRKHGTHIDQIKKSKWGSFAGLVAHQQKRRLEKITRRHCKVCGTQFHSRGSLKRHTCK
jgi:hypothetical protein